MSPSFAVCFEGRLSSEVRQTGVPVHVLGEVSARKPWTVWRARRKLAEILKQQPCDLMVCHSAWPHAVFGPVVRRAGMPLVTWIHDPARGVHWVERWARRTRPDFVVCNSRFTAGSLKNLFPDVRFEIVYCPVHPSRSQAGDWEREVEDRSRVRGELSTAEDAVVVIQVSRLERWKGHLLHLEALGKLRLEPGWEAWFVGGAQRPREARYLEELKSRAADLNIVNRVRFLGHRSDVPRLLAAADIHCQPNMGAEPFGITFVEGLHAGLPVITTAWGGALEIVNDSCGILVPPGNAAALADSLRDLIHDPERRRRLGRAGPTRARSLCDPGQQMARLQSLCHHILDERMAA